MGRGTGRPPRQRCQARHMPRPAAGTGRQELFRVLQGKFYFRSFRRKDLPRAFQMAWCVLLAHNRADVESNIVNICVFSFAGLRGKTAQVALFSQQPSEAPRQCPLTEKNREVKSLDQGHTADKFQRERLKHRQSDNLALYWLLASFPLHAPKACHLLSVHQHPPPPPV